MLIITILLALGGSACSDVSERDGFPPTVPAPGERVVNLSLTGLAGAGAVPTRAGNESLTLAGECEVRSLTVYCFVSWDGSAELTDVKDFKHERTYRYEAGGTANDFVLLPDADGYHAGIGVPEGDTHRRAFLVCANREISNPSSVDWANLTYGGAAGSFGWALDTDAGGGAAEQVSPVCPLPMSARVTHRVISSEGVITDDPVFGQQRLDEGIPVRLVRGVSRIDIINPDITGYRVEAIQVKAAPKISLFGEPAEQTAAGYRAITVTNGEEVNGACYLFPLKADKEVEVTLTGKLMNSPVTLTARGVMKPNTRYRLRVRNDDANVEVSLEVADWDEGDGMDTDDLSGKLNAGCTVAAAEEAGVTVGADTITLKDGTLTLSAPAIVTLTGAAGDTKPIGIQIPEGCGWLAAGTGQVTGASPSQTFQISLEIREVASTRKINRAPIRIGNDYPLSVPVNFVYQKGGKPCFREYTVCLEPAAAVSPALASVEVSGVGLMKDLCRVDPDTRVIRLPAFGGATFEVRGREAATRAIDDPVQGYLQCFALADYDWLKRVRMSGSIASYFYFQADENTTGQPREATFRAQYLDAGNADAPVEIDWRVVQEAHPDPARMADDVEVKLPLREAGQLRMEGDEIRVAMHDPISLGDGVGNSISFYDGYIQTLRERGAAAAEKEVEAVKERVSYGKTDENSPWCVGLLYPALSAPVEVTAGASWLHVGYPATAPCVSLKADPYLPVSVDEIGKLTAREATVTVRLRDGKTRELTVRQEPYGGEK